MATVRRHGYRVKCPGPATGTIAGPRDLIPRNVYLIVSIVSLATPAAEQANRIATRDVSYHTTAGFNVGAFGVLAILCVLYFVWW